MFNVSLVKLPFFINGIPFLFLELSHYDELLGSDFTVKRPSNGVPIRIAKDAIEVLVIELPIAIILIALQ